MPSSPRLSVLAFSLLAACTSSEDHNIPDGCLTLTGRYGAGAEGSRPFTIEAIASACTTRREVYLCHVGTFTTSSNSFQPYVADLAIVGPLADPFAGSQFSESNGQLGYVCAEIAREQAPEIRACLTTGSTCPSVTEAEERLQANLASTGYRRATLRPGA